MPNTTEKHKKKIAPIICAALFIGFLCLYLAILIFPMINASVGGGILAIGILLMVILLIIAAIGGIVLALHQRLQEIEGGEEDDAKQY